MSTLVCSLTDKKIGFVKWFDNRKGYGFIRLDENDEEDVFVHFSNIDMEGYKKLDQGDKVKFDLRESDHKGPEAINVKVVVKDLRYH